MNKELQTEFQHKSEVSEKWKPGRWPGELQSYCLVVQEAGQEIQGEYRVELLKECEEQ